MSKPKVTAVEFYYRREMIAGNPEEWTRIVIHTDAEVENQREVLDLREGIVDTAAVREAVTAYMAGMFRYLKSAPDPVLVRTPYQEAARAVALARHRVKWQGQDFADRKERIALNLEGLAEDVRRTRPYIHEGSYAQVARDVLHAVLWAVPNLHLDGLPDDGAEYDQALAELAAAEESLTGFAGSPEAEYAAWQQEQKESEQEEAHV